MVWRRPCINRKVKLAIMFLIAAIRCRDRAKTMRTSRETVVRDETMLYGLAFSVTQRTISALVQVRLDLKFCEMGKNTWSPFWYADDIHLSISQEILEPLWR